MTTPANEALLAVQKAREALRNNDRSEARHLAERATELAPQMEDPWLILAAVASPRASLDYVQRALKIEPESPRARRALEWAMQRLRDTQGLNPELQKSSESLESSVPASAPDLQPGKVSQGPSRSIPAGIPRGKGPETSNASLKSKRTPLFPILLFGLGCLVCAAAAWSAAASPVVASILKQPVVESTHPPSWAQASIPKPTYTPAAPSSQMADLEGTATPEFLPTGSPTELSTDLPTGSPTALSTGLPTDQPTEMAAEQPTGTSEPISSGSISLEYVPDTPTSQVPSSAATHAPSSPGYASNDGTHWIDVNLSQQMLYAYSGNTVVNSFLVSTGTWQYPTVTGQYHVYVKLRYTDMSGPDYYLPNVPYTMYFYQSYGLHGTYWHHNFGTPMSHGCVNLSIPDSAWLYDFSSVGTLVNIHY
jgi:lipoprotein-anchoring transpeptidase ErfK/SrfK